MQCSDPVLTHRLLLTHYSGVPSVGHKQQDTWGALGGGEGGGLAGVQPRLIQGIRSGDGVGDLFNYLFIKDIKSNRMRIAQ